MTDDTGGIVDDGVACRLGDEHFYVTTTTTGSDAVYRNMLRRNAEWGLEVDALNVTSTYAAMNIAGPTSTIPPVSRFADRTRQNFSIACTRSRTKNSLSVVAVTC